MTPVDDLRVGQWVAICAFKFKSREGNSGFVGKPLRIEAISLPWLAVTDGKDGDTIDLRFYDVKLLSKKYVDVFQSFVPKKVRKPKKCTNRSDGPCPKCGLSMTRSALSLNNGEVNLLILRCMGCGFGDPQKG